MLVRMKKAQSTLEYALLISVVVGSLLFMQNYMKRSFQGRLQKTGDSIGQQYSPHMTYRNDISDSEVKIHEVQGRGDAEQADKQTNYDEGIRTQTTERRLRDLTEEEWPDDSSNVAN